ncbi:MAG: hypothetical protein NXI23_05135 [Bacteroidetes bacterium]|jgi:hypothetical protein|nr:hypothetical protein [Bacteroidota bacterium]MDF1863211.1 hypothetical protein [Saprospiraceae bacterium]
MEKTKHSNGWLWVFGFMLIFLLTQDYLWNQSKPEIGFLGMPEWLFWFVDVHIVFLLIFIFFSKKYWKE